MSKSIIWQKKPEREDCEAALGFLRLLCPDSTSARLVRALRSARPSKQSAKDLLRASNLPLLPADDPHVDADLKKIHKGKGVAPVLLIRGDIRKARPLTVADGYHRICAVCYFDEDAPVACRVISL